MKSSTNMSIAFLLNLSFAIIEFIYGLKFNSNAILSDAIHDAGDALAIGFSTLLEYLSNQPSNHRFTFGYKRLSLAGALCTSLILVFGSIFVIIRSFPRLLHPEPVNYDGMLILAILAIIMNYTAQRLLSKGQTHNEEILSLHFLEDTLGWAGIIVISFIIKYTSWYVLDPLFSLGISSFILTKAVPKLFETLRLFFEGVPASCNLSEIKEKLHTIDEIDQILQFNIWSLDGLENMASLHIVLKEDRHAASVKDKIYHHLNESNIHHATIQFDENAHEHKAHTKEITQTHHHHHHH